MNGKETAHYTHFVKSKLRAEETSLLFLEGWIGEMMCSGDNTQHNGCFILTDQRVVFCRKGILGEVFEAIALERISSVETRSTMGYRVLTLHTSNDAMRFKTFEPAPLFEKVYNRVDELRGGSPSQPPQRNSASPLEALKQLGELRDAGLLSDDEFNVKKQELLSRL